MSNQEQEETQLKNWFITQLFAIEAGALDEDKKDKILTFMEANKKNPKIQEWFKDFEKIKTNQEQQQEKFITEEEFYATEQCITEDGKHDVVDGHCCNCCACDTCVSRLEEEEEEEDKTCWTCKKEYEVEPGRGGYDGHQCFDCFQKENGADEEEENLHIGCIENQLDNMLYEKNMDWTFDKPESGKYETIYIIEKEEEEEE